MTKKIISPDEYEEQKTARSNSGFHYCWQEMQKPCDCGVKHSIWIKGVQPDSLDVLSFPCGTLKRDDVEFHPVFTAWNPVYNLSPPEDFLECKVVRKKQEMD